MKPPMPHSPDPFLDYAQAVQTATSPIGIHTLDSTTQKKKFVPIGTGFFISESGLFLTAAHLPDISDTFILMPDGADIKCSCMKKGFRVSPTGPPMDSYDLSLYQGPEPKAHKGGHARLGDRRKFKIGERVASVSYYRQGFTIKFGPFKTLTPLLTTGVISARQFVSSGGRVLGSRFVLDITAGPGSSGAPVFLQDSGDVIGVIVTTKVHRISRKGEDPTHDIPLGIVQCEPVAPVLQWLERAQPELYEKHFAESKDAAEDPE